MRYPEFFDLAPTIKVQDSLSQFLGAMHDGVIEYRFVDVVKLAGHSCPTVAGAYLMARAALKALYGDELAQRGGVAIKMRGRASEGTVGVVASVFTLITGATGEAGFKGIAGNFARNDLLRFGYELPADASFTRLDNAKTVLVSYDPSFIGGNPKQGVLMQKALAGNATEEELTEFGELWQERVKKILVDFCDDARLIKVMPAVL